MRQDLENFVNIPQVGQVCTSLLRLNPRVIEAMNRAGMTGRIDLASYNFYKMKGNEDKSLSLEVEHIERVFRALGSDILTSQQYEIVRDYASKTGGELNDSIMNVCGLAIYAAAESA